MIHSLIFWQQNINKFIGKTTRGFCFVDATPISNIKEDSITNFVFSVPDLFEYGYQLSYLFACIVLLRAITLWMLQPIMLSI